MHCLLSPDAGSMHFINFTAMTEIGLLSDTHSHIDKRILHHLEGCDEVWHAGDIGDIAVTDLLEKRWKVVAVNGNIDNATIRKVWPEDQIFHCEQVKVWMTHIGGKPFKYSKGIRERLKEIAPKIFICGHSHILKVQMDHTLNVLYMNPGAAGHHGFHKMRTLIRFAIDGDQIKDMRVIELGKRGYMKA